MQEQMLLKISLLISLAGLVSLFWIASNPDFDATPVGSITPDDVGRAIKACGDIEDKFTSKNGHVFFQLNDGSGKIKVVVFNSTKITVGEESSCVTGRVDVYKGEIEIIANVVENV